jgi:hypothetical protein
MSLLRTATATADDHAVPSPIRTPIQAATKAGQRTVKLAVVVQRYGADINGGAELHARYVAEHLARHAEVTF